MLWLAIIFHKNVILIKLFKFIANQFISNLGTLWFNFLSICVDTVCDNWSLYFQFGVEPTGKN